MNDKNAPGSTGFERLSQEDARLRGLSMEDYGVYKGSKGSAFKPVNSAKGLLILSLILTALGVALLALFVSTIMQELGYLARPVNYTHLTPISAILYLSTLIFPVWSWMLYRKERKAQKSRESKGLPRNLS